MKFHLIPIILIFSAFSGFTQPANDACVDAIQLCSGVTLSGTTTDATIDASSDHTFCEPIPSTVWYKFTTNASGGDVTIDFINVVLDPAPNKGQELRAIIYNPGTACDQVTYVLASGCAGAGVDFFVTALACTASTTYYVQVMGTMLGGGVTEPADATFDVLASGPGMDVTYPTVTITASNFDLCQGDDQPISITITDCSDTVRYDWYYDGSLILSTTEDTFSTSMLSDTGNLELIVFCDAVCDITDTSAILTFNVTPISADAGPDQFIELGQSATIDGTGTGTPNWIPPTNLSNTGVYQPLATPTITTEYFLTVTNNGCIAVDNMKVHVGGVIIIYHGFTPNGDGINDKWLIGNSSQFPNMEVYVYDRSGQKVFSATNYDSPDQWWDGTYRGRLLPVSAYFYVIDLNSSGTKGDIYKGIVTIVR
ncbi:gliding motility-associated C-terminal domain-containing protein [Crocinitomix catalasitica]|nr:gliding motility-associated C-terminal domain-containing protein [Crocinitomix catalasitica]